MLDKPFLRCLAAGSAVTQHSVHIDTERLINILHLQWCKFCLLTHVLGVQTAFVPAALENLTCAWVHTRASYMIDIRICHIRMLLGDDEAGTAHAGRLTHPQGVRPPGFHQPPARPPAGQRQPQQQQPQRQQGNAKAGKLWVLDGRIYNYR